jgi:hypothetical protein
MTRDAEHSRERRAALDARKPRYERGLVDFRHVPSRFEGGTLTTKLIITIRVEIDNGDVLVEITIEIPWEPRPYGRVAGRAD